MPPDAPLTNDQAAENEPSPRHPYYYHRPGIPLLFSLIAGIIAGRYTPVPGLTMVAWLIVFACMGLLIRSIYKQTPVIYAPLSLFFALGWLAISSFLPPAFPPEPVLPYLDEKPVAFSGTVYEPPVEQGFRTRCVLEDLHVYPDGDMQTPVSLPGRLQLTVYGDAPDILPGVHIAANRPIRSLRNFNNPGGFDYKQFMAYKGIWGTAWDNGSRITVTPKDSSPSLFLSVSAMRMAVDDAIASVSQGDTRAVLSALVVGKRALISPSLRDSFSRAGVSHLLAISGLHVGIVATVSFFLCAAVFGRIPFLLKRAFVKKAAALLSMLFVLGYGMLAGMSPSTQRAVIMICILLFAYLFDRQYNPANTLALAALGILAIFPQSLFNISFQLSFAAVTAIFMGLHYVPLPSKTGDERLKKRFGRIVGGFVWVSVLAIIGTMPIVAHYFNQVTVLGIAANLVLVPLIGFIVVPLALASSMLYFIVPPVALYGLSGADSLLTAALFIVARISAFPYGSFKTVTPSVIEMACVYALLISLPMLAASSGDKRLSAAPKKAMTAVTLLAIVVLIADVGYWINRRYWHNDLIVTHLDVGQGNAALVEMPGGRTMLVDGGGFSDNASFDVGALIVAPYLWRNKIRSIDKVVLSHPHSDHINGLLYILDNFNIGKVISTHYPADTANYRRFIEIIQERDIFHPPFSDIRESKRINGVDVDIYYPPLNRAPDMAPANLNNGSIVLKLTYGGTSFLFPGDLERAAEAEVVRLAGDRLDADHLLSPHHGSSTSSTRGFLAAVDPKTVVVSARSDRFGFPAEDVMERYNKRGYDVYKTEKHGAVRIIVRDDKAVVLPTVRGQQR